jgi:hypothetical protein
MCYTYYTGIARSQFDKEARNLPKQHRIWISEDSDGSIVVIQATGLLVAVRFRFFSPASEVKLLLAAI